MRFCPVCNRAPRAHDPMWSVQVIPGDLLSALGWPAGGYAVCHDCLRVGMPDQWAPLAVPVPRPNVDPAADPKTLYWCACCQNYARESDGIAHNYAALRVLQEDLDAHPDLLPRAKAGVIRCCEECWAVWGEVVRRRWERDGIVPAGTPLAALGTNMV